MGDSFTGDMGSRLDLRSGSGHSAASLAPGKSSTMPRLPRTTGSKRSTAPKEEEDDHLANIMLFQCYAEVLCEALPSLKKQKEKDKEKDKDKDWRRLTFILEGQQIMLFRVEDRKPVRVHQSSEYFRWKMKKNEDIGP